MTARFPPGSTAWRLRVELMIADEMKKPERWHWMSFVGDSGKFLGVCIVKARGIATATRETHQLGINPGGQIMCVPIPDGAPEPPWQWTYMLLNEQEAKALDDLMMASLEKKP